MLCGRTVAIDLTCNIANCLEIQVTPHYTQAMPYDRDLRLRAIKYTEEGHTLAQAAAVFKVNIGTLIGWRKRYRATGDVKMKIRCPVNKKIIPEKHALFDLVEQGYEFSIAQIARLRTLHCKVTCSETEISEQV